MFDTVYSKFLDYHRTNRTGERLRRLQEGHGHAEKLFLEQVWWPAFHHLNYLHPEYEVSDFKEGKRYIDFAYIHSYLKLALEIDGYGPHSRNQSRYQFSDQLRRQNHLMIDNWRILRFSYDDIVEKPRLCQQEIQQFMGRWLGEENQVDPATCIEKEIVRHAIRICRPITASDVCKLLSIENKYARKLLSNLVNKRWLEPLNPDKKRIHAYILDIEGKNMML